jgi:hypothetical protein
LRRLHPLIAAPRAGFIFPKTHVVFAIDRIGPCRYGIAPAQRAAEAIELIVVQGNERVTRAYDVICGATPSKK